MAHLQQCLVELGPGVSLSDPRVSAHLDERDPLRQFRDQFVLPTLTSSPTSADRPQTDWTYLAGNSLGALSRKSKVLVNEELDVWGTHAVEGHFSSHPHGRGWMRIADTVLPTLSRLVGAQEKEIACMGTLTSNLHLMMTTFYQPTSERFKILCEAKAFPSDQYAFASQALLHGFDPATAVIELYPRAGEFTLREEDIVAAIAEHGPSLALVLFSGVQYYTGQYFPIQQITKAAHQQGAICGWDLAHAVGNVPLSLHDWDVDFAVWCSYKYLNSGAGGIGGLFIHEKWDGREAPKLAGWWGHDESTRFKMPPKFSAIPGAQGFQQSNPSVLSTVSLLGSLQVFDAAGGIQPLREKSLSLTAYLERLLKALPAFIEPSAFPPSTQSPTFTIITPSTPESRGAQLSLLFHPPSIMRTVAEKLKHRGVIGDEREPDVIRFAPVPLYNRYEDCRRTAEMLGEVLSEL